MTDKVEYTEDGIKFKEIIGKNVYTIIAWMDEDWTWNWNVVDEYGAWRATGLIEYKR